MTKSEGDKTWIDHPRDDALKHEAMPSNVTFGALWAIRGETLAATNDQCVSMPTRSFNHEFLRVDASIIAIASCDILSVVPVILPFLLFGFGHIPLTISRFIAAFAIGNIVYLFAERTGRRKYLAGAIFAILTVVVMWVTYCFGW